jgi:nicotinamidase-related amidase
MEINEGIKKALHPSKSVVLLWDIQNRLVENIFNTKEFLEQNLKIVDTARNNDIPLIFSKITPLPERFESPVRKLLFNSRFASMKQVPNGFDLTIPPLENDIILPKHTASMFIGTHFEQLLRNAEIGTIIITGIATEIGVESTARDAINRGFLPVIISDAVSSVDKEAHNRSLENLRNLALVITTAEICAIWQS